MQMPISFIPSPPRRSGQPKRRAATSPPAIAPTLVAATYESTTSVTLVFDRAVNVSAMDASSVVVTDGEEMTTLVGQSFVSVNATTVLVMLTIDGESEESGVHLNVAASNGIVAVGGSMWVGCSDVALPFSS